MRTIGNQEYLTQKEAIQFLNDKGIPFVSPTTFRTLKDRYGIKGRSITGQGKALFYIKEDLEKIPLVQVEE